MKRKLLYIVNPISGTEKKEPLKDFIQTETTKAELPFEIITSLSGGDYRFLKPVIKNKGITDVIIAGGDGTVNQVIDSLYDLNVRFGIIPCGSGNGLAFTARIPKNPEKALQIVFKAKTKSTDAFFINNRFACMLCGLGFDAQVAHDFAHHHRRGKAAYINKIISNLLKAPVYSFSITANNQTIDVEAYFISIANSNQYGNHFTIAPKASLTDGLLDVVIATRQNKLSLLVQTLKQVGGFNELQEFELMSETDSILYFRVKQLRIINHQGAPLHIDGDPAKTAATINAVIKEKAFQLIYP